MADGTVTENITINEAPPKKSGKKVPLGLLGMLVLVVLTEGYIARRKDLSTAVALEWKMTGSAVKRQAPITLIPCFGTSLTHAGVAPRILEEKLGKSTYNFALSGAQPFATYTMLKHVLESGCKPEAVIVEFKWTAIYTDYVCNERVLPEIATMRDCFDLAWTTRDPVFFARLALIANLPSFRCREEIRSNIVAGLDGKEPPRLHELSIMGRNAIVNKGANHPTRNPRFTGEVDPATPHLFKKDWACHPIAELYIHKFLELTADRNIPVFWLIPPVAPGTQAERDRLGLEANYTDFIKSVTAKHPGVTVVDGRFSSYANGVFIDATHLNRDGAVAFTNDLADIMKPELEPMRDKSQHWVSLPKYRPSPDTKKIEDMMDSLVAIAREKQAARR